MSSRGQSHDQGVGFGQVLREEMQAILQVRLPDPPTVAKNATDAEIAAAAALDEKTTVAAVDALDTDLAALCLSGGGIRSATFALGVMQGLARFGLLGQFHYLSSVSGGGYIASWLSAWRHLAKDEEVFAALNRSMHTGKEAPQVTGIRADSNYLTPQLGLLSADTWTVVALYIRNLVLNWLLFVPFFMGCFMLPRICAALLSYVAAFGHSPQMFSGARYGGALLVMVGLSFAIYGRFRKADGWLTDSRFRTLALLPMVLSGALFTLASVAAGTGPDAAAMREFSWQNLLVGTGWGGGIYFIAWALGRFSSRSVTEPSEFTIEVKDVVCWTLSGALVGKIATIGMITIEKSFAGEGALGAVKGATVLGLSGFVLAYLIGELFYVGISSYSRKGDMDREWLARSSGWLSATAMSWMFFSAIALYAPDLLRAGWTWVAASLAGGVSGLVTLVIGSSGLTAATKAAQSLKSVPLMRLASGAAMVFAVLLASLLSLADQQLETLLWSLQWDFLPSVFWIDLFLAVVLIGTAVILSVFINVNRFSMHALYANRLIRAFLGSARAAARKPDPFTGFDPADNLRLATVVPLEGSRSLFHVINATLNVVSKENSAWQERKAESFTMSRLFCGNPYVHFQPTRNYGGRESGGLSLGTAMAISGAAVSPNQGYNSSPLIGFLLMLFNVRLGWWLGSPKKSTCTCEGPTLSLSPALRELAGDTTDNSQWIYLSDGGHFENLGLYEMVRRRCRLIVVSDAGCDPDFAFEDLGNAVRKIYIDFGVSIEFAKLEIKARQNPPVAGLRFAIGTIKYPGSNRLGWLLYVKPTYQGTERADVRSYATAHSTFPHESTTDQWFSESQLESYRALGASITEFICSGGDGAPAGQVPDPLTLETLKEIAMALMYGK